MKLRMLTMRIVANVIRGEGEEFEAEARYGQRLVDTGQAEDITPGPGTAAPETAGDQADEDDGQAEADDPAAPSTPAPASGSARVTGRARVTPRPARANPTA